MAPSPKAPAEDGTMKEDLHWILKLDTRNAIKDVKFRSSKNKKFKIPEVQPVTCAPCSYDEWRLAPHIEKKPVLRITALLGLRTERWLGRRIGDEVEMFEEGMKREYKNLRKALQAKGLTVRAHIPQSESSKKFPQVTRKAIMGGEGNTLMHKCVEHLEKAVAQLWPEETLEYGLVCDVPDPRAKTIAVARVPEEMKDARTITKMDELGLQSLDCKTVGIIREGKVKFACSDEEAKAYFDSLGKTDRMVVIDEVRTREVAAEAEAKARKRREKKHRRQVTASTVTQVSSPKSEGGSVAAAEDGEAMRARQRAKYTAKRKAQKDRKKKAAAEVEVEAADDVVKSVHVVTSSHADGNKEVGMKKKDRDSGGQIITDAWSSNIVLRDENGTFTTEPMVYVTLGEGEKGDVDKASLGSKSSSSESDNDGEEGNHMLEVVRIKNMDDARRVMAERAGRTILTATEENNSALGLQHLGRGL